MKRNLLTLAITASLALVLSACEQQQEEVVTVEDPTVAEEAQDLEEYSTQTATPTELPAEDRQRDMAATDRDRITQGDRTGQLGYETTSDRNQTAGPALTLARSEEQGEYLADSEGRPLYILEGETSGETRCDAECLQVWPPFVATDSQPFAAQGELDSALIGTQPLEDGTQQVTYDGMPLYYYVADLGNEQVTGLVEDQWGEWYLVGPSGEKVGEHKDHS